MRRIGLTAAILASMAMSASPDNYEAQERAKKVTRPRKTSPDSRYCGMGKKRHGHAAQKRAAKKRRNIRARSAK